MREGGWSRSRLRLFAPLLLTSLFMNWFNSLIDCQPQHT